MMLGFCCLGAGQTIPSWFPKPPPLPPPRGEVIRVHTADELLAAVDRLANGGTILLADGQYKLSRPVVLDQKQNVLLRSASGEAGKVTLVGKGWEQGDDHDGILRISRCEGVTIADLSFADCRSYGIKVEAEHAPKDVNILNCRFRDIGVRAIKGSAAQNSDLRAVKGSVRPTSGNLALTTVATNAFGRGVSLAEVAEDIRQQPRKGNPDLGAWEFERKGAPPKRYGVRATEP